MTPQSVILSLPKESPYHRKRRRFLDKLGMTVTWRFASFSMPSNAIFPFDGNTVIRYIYIMTATIQISSRGTMTLPKRLRQTLGVDKGGIVMADVTGDGVVLHPAAAFPIELYSDARVAEFDAEDAALAKALADKPE
jgi:bifunctional DNA-binding transcriptional regulator/antitoxin component of YhaV-PrlF toxin-antitoxin module